MYKNKRVCVVIPAFNEETQIRRTVETIPDFVDDIIVVDDCSQDSTADIVAMLATNNNRIMLIRHEINKGVGAAISTGYKWARDNEFDVAVKKVNDACKKAGKKCVILKTVKCGQQSPRFYRICVDFKIEPKFWFF